MKKTFFAAVSFLLIFISFSLYSDSASKSKATVKTVFKGSGKTANPENPAVTGILGDDWNAGIDFPGSTFENLKKNDVIEIHVKSVDVSDKENKLSRLYFRTVDYRNVYFEKLSVTPKLDSLSKKEENGFMESRLQLDMNGPDTEYTVRIVLTEADISLLQEGGLSLKGPNSIIQTVKIYHQETAEKKSQPKVKKTGSKLNPKVSEMEKQYSDYEEKRTEFLKRYKSYKVPFIYITTLNHQDVATKNYYDSVIDVMNCSEEYQLSKRGQIKIRGNSTADSKYGMQMPYRIKFNDKQNLLGLHKGKKYKSWVLLKASLFYAGDYLGFNLANEIYKTSRFDYYASDCTFVHVFINEKYMGQYLLCEQSENEKGRVSVSENKEKSKDKKIGYMLELDNYIWSDLKDNARWFGNSCSQGTEEYHFGINYLSSKYPKDNGKTPNIWASPEDKAAQNDGAFWKGAVITDVNGESRVCIPDDFSIKTDIYADSQVEFIQKYVKNLWNICYHAIQHHEYYKFNADYNLVAAPEYKTAIETVSAVIDMDSLYNEMILEELVRDNDVGAGSLYMAIDFTKSPDKKYGKFTFECPWDFNWAYQGIESDKDKGAYWENKIQYFAGAWQTLNLLEDKYDRSHPWFVLFNNDPDIRRALREKWNTIGKSNLKAVADKTDLAAEKAGKDMNGSNSRWLTDFVRNRIDYIDRYLWK